MRITNVKLNYPNTSLHCANSIWLVRWQCKNVRWNPDFRSKRKMPLLSENDRMLSSGVVLWLFLQHRIFSTTFIPARRISIQSGVRLSTQHSAAQLTSKSTISAAVAAAAATIIFHIFIFHHILCIIYYSIKRIKWSRLPFPTNPNATPFKRWQLILLYAFVIHMDRSTSSHYTCVFSWDSFPHSHCFSSIFSLIFSTRSLSLCVFLISFAFAITIAFAFVCVALFNSKS